MRYSIFLFINDKFDIYLVRISRVFVNIHTGWLTCNSEIYKINCNNQKNQITFKQIQYQFEMRVGRTEIFIKKSYTSDDTNATDDLDETDRIYLDKFKLLRLRNSIDNIDELQKFIDNPQPIESFIEFIKTNNINNDPATIFTFDKDEQNIVENNFRIEIEMQDELDAMQRGKRIDPYDTMLK